MEAALDLPESLRVQDPRLVSSLPESLEDSPEQRLVIAIDYGTTYTGVAIATPSGNRANLHEIEVIQDWGPGMGNHQKIPSVYSYSLKSAKREQQWGTDLSPQAIAMVHTKLQLDVDNTSKELDLILEALDGMRDLDFRYISDTSGAPKYTRKGPEEIVQDYLEKVFDRLIDEVESRISEELRYRIPVDIVATIPAEWGYRAKNSTFRALTGAGFNKDNFPELREMLLVSEPEAAAIYTARHLTEERGASFLRKGECFVLCDAGGGTVDVVSYKVKQLYPTFEIEPTTIPTGDKCGAIFINLAFKRWLKNLIGERNYQQLDQTLLIHKISSHDVEGEYMRELMKNFDIHKRKFKEGHRDIKMDLPGPLENLNIENTVVGGQFIITYNDMKSFFEPTCATPIVNLIQGQVEQLEAKGSRLKNVFLVGGFAESPYLQESIKGSLDVRGLELRIPDTSWTAVVRGAAIFGIEKSSNKALSAMSACAQSYGVASDVPFSNILHDKRDFVVDSMTRVAMAKDQMKWMIKKGDLILSNDPKEVKGTFISNFTEEGPKPSGKIPIYAFKGDLLPDRLANSHSELTECHVINYDLKDIPLPEFTRGRVVGSNPPFYTASLTLVMRQLPRALHVELKMGERIIHVMDVAEAIVEE